MSEDPSALARKRRKAIIQSQRSEAEILEDTARTAEVVAAAAAATPATTSESTTVTASKRKAPTGADQPEAAILTQPTPTAKKIKAKKTQAAGEDSADEAKKKAQIRYDPEVPMSKEQLAAWRREARRVRNRESAAASRARIRSRITELEEEVGEWKTKYAQALERLQNLEKSKGKSASEAASTPKNQI